MTTSKLIAVTMVFGLGLVFAPVAWAAWNVKVQAASTKLDSVLASMTGADAKVASNFKAVWDKFKATRENEIIPALYKGIRRCHEDC